MNMIQEFEMQMRGSHTDTLHELNFDLCAALHIFPAQAEAKVKGHANFNYNPQSAHLHTSQTTILPSQFKP
jgi:hypothetical protein